MLFNSLEFAVFLPIVFALYWMLNANRSAQNLLLLVASYFFYACWDFRFLFLLIFSTLLDYCSGLMVYRASSNVNRKFWLWLSVGVNLGFLGVFKYYNFFASSFAGFLEGFGFHVEVWTLQVILPVGISFYTFHGLSYVFDIYRGKIKPITNVMDYSVFVSFFPLLVAGPIERATHLLPQIQRERHFDRSKAVDGLRQILWGFFKKMVIADNCGEFANTIFNNHIAYSGSTHVLGAVFFAFQIYCDFSGYSDIALGTARLFGIELLRNFAFPYFSRDIAEFWRRWHISLSSWFRDYLYIPLGGSHGGNWKKIRNIFIIFIVSGFWHGANWTFVAWGALNALYFLPLLLLKRNRNNMEIVAQGRLLPTGREFFSIAVTFGLTVFAWIFFRSASISEALNYIAVFFSRSLLSIPYFPGIGRAMITSFLVLAFLIMEWFGREQAYAIQATGVRWPKALRWVFYYAIITAIFTFSGTAQEFIYFQF